MPDNKYKAIPDPLPDVNSLLQAVSALKEVVEVLTRQRQPLLNGAVTFQDLVNFGLIGTDGRALQDHGTNLNYLNQLLGGATGAATAATIAGALQAANNLDDVADLPTTQTNLGLAAVALSGDYADLTGTPGTADVVLLDTQTGSGVASLDFTSGINSTYSAYLFNIVLLRPATNAVQLLAQVHSGGAWKTSGYLSGATVVDSNAAAGSVSDTTGVRLTGNAASNSSSWGLTGTVKLFQPSDTSVAKPIVADTSFFTSASLLERLFGDGAWNGTGAIDGVRFIASSGNLTGTVKMFGFV